MFTKSFVFSLFAFAVCATAQADVTVINTVDSTLLDGTFSSGQTGFATGTSIAESFVTGSQVLTLSNVVFPQITQSGVANVDGYSATETFALYANVFDPLDSHNKPALVPLFSFTLQNNTTVNPMTNPAAFGETTATAPAASLLLANTRYWLVLTNGGGQVAWDYTTKVTYSSALGYTLPATDTVITEDNGQTISPLSDGPQQFVLNVVPEPSTYCLMAVAGLALVVSRKRTRKLA